MSSTGVVLIRGMFFHFIMLCLTDITTTIHSRFFPSFYVMFDFYITTTIHSRFFSRCSVLPCTTEALQWTRPMRGRRHGLPVRRRLRGWVCRVLLTTTVVVGDIETEFLFFLFCFSFLFFTWYLFFFDSTMVVGDDCAEKAVVDPLDKFKGLLGDLNDDSWMQEKMKRWREDTGKGTKRTGTSEMKMGGRFEGWANWLTIVWTCWWWRQAEHLEL